MAAARIAVLGLLLVAPLAAAQPAGLVAEGLRATGEVTTQSELTLLLRDRNPIATADFHLEAGALRVEVDVADPVLAADATTLRHDADTETTHYSNVDVTGQAVRPGQRWVLLPMPTGATVESSASCQSITPAKVDDVTRNPRAKLDRGPMHADTSSALFSEACEASDVTITGDFVLALWEWDILVQGPEGEQAYWSGDRASRSLRSGSLREYREVFLFATDAALQVTVQPDDHVYMAREGMRVDGSILLDGAAGTMTAPAGSVRFHGESAHITGDLDVMAEGGDGGMRVAVGGRVDQVRIGNDLVNPESSWTGPLLVGLLASAVLVGVAVVGSHRRALGAYQEACRAGKDTWTTTPQSRREERAMGWNVMAKDALDSKRNVRGLLYAHVALRTAPLVSDHAWMRRQAHMRLGWLGGARRAHRRLAHVLKDARSRGDNAAEAAKLCIRQGRQEEALQWLRAGRQEHFSCLQVAWDDPLLKPLVKQAYGRVPVLRRPQVDEPMRRS